MSIILEKVQEILSHQFSLNKSEVINRILSDDLNYVMPPTSSHLTLNPREKAIIVKWVEQGAVWKKHWAFIPPQKPET